MLDFNCEINRPEEGTIEAQMWDSINEMPFFKFTGMQAVKYAKDEVIGKVEIKEELKNLAGSVHGGMLYTLCDTFAGALAAIYAECKVVTVNSHIEFLRPAITDTLYCKATVLKLGRNFLRTQGDVYDENGTHLVTTINTYYPI